MLNAAARAWGRFRRASPKEAAGYLLYRFHSLRVGMGAAKRFTRSHARRSANAHVLRDVDVAAAVEALKSDAYCDGIDLPSEFVAGIEAFVSRAMCTACISGREIAFAYEERRKVEAEVGHPIHMASYNVRDCDLIQELAGDEAVNAIASAYLGFPVKQVLPRLFWSFVVDLDEADRLRRGQTVQFHYDLHGFNFLYFHFYLTDVDESAGAHVLVRGSHGRKPLRFLLSSANQPDDEIISTYGADRVVTLVGPRGYGFAEDTYCYHKATPPVSSDRLMLQLRIS